MKHWDNLLPEGLYRFQVVEAERMKSQVTDSMFWRVKFVLEGFDRIEYDFFSENPNASWKAKQLVEEIEDLKMLAGAVYLVDYRHEVYAQGKRGRIHQYLARATT